MTARVIDRPEAGWFECRLVKAGPWVPCAIEYSPTRDPDFPDNPMSRSYWWQAVICGQPAGEPTIEPSENVWKIWHSGRAIDKARYDLLVAQCAWDREWNPSSPLANPYRAIILAEISPSSLF